jgi:signal transduction histidine kinase
MSQKTAEFEQAIAYMRILVQLLDEKLLPRSGQQRLHWILQQLGDVLDLEYAWVALHDTTAATSSATVTDEYQHESRRDFVRRSSIMERSIAIKDFPDFYQLLLLGVSWIDPPISMLPLAYADLLKPDDQLLICLILAKQRIDQPPVIAGEVGLIATGRVPWTNPLQVKLITQIVSYAASISRQAELEDPVQAQKVDLAMLSYLKEDFISSVSHELKTPLENMKRAIEMAQYLVQKLQPLAYGAIDFHREQNQIKHKLINYLQVLAEEWQSEYDFVNDLLNLKTPLTPIEPMYLNRIVLQQCITDLLGQFSEAAARFGQTLSFHVQPSNLMIFSHASSLEKIIKELLNNAIKYTPPNQQIRVSAQLIDGQFELRVTNTGITIPASELDPIFKAFYRIPRSNPWDYCGTGLGLALVKKLVLRLDGEIHAESRNQVTTFVVQLPALIDQDSVILAAGLRSS